MQAVAIGASVAYPLLRLARTIPLPVLMVGAGLFFAGSKTGQAAAQKASDMASDLSDEAMRRVRELQDQAGESALARDDSKVFRLGILSPVARRSRRYALSRSLNSPGLVSSKGKT